MKFSVNWLREFVDLPTKPEDIADLLTRAGIEIKKVETRGGDIDMVDWIENIPIDETRNYVQRVLENLQVYRGQVGRNSAFSLVSDLAR